MTCRPGLRFTVIYESFAEPWQAQHMVSGPHPLDYLQINPSLPPSRPGCCSKDAENRSLWFPAYRQYYSAAFVPVVEHWAMQTTWMFYPIIAQVFYGTLEWQLTGGGYCSSIVPGREQIHFWWRNCGVLLELKWIGIVCFMSPYGEPILHSLAELLSTPPSVYISLLGAISVMSPLRIVWVLPMLGLWGLKFHYISQRYLEQISLSACQFRDVCTELHWAMALDEMDAEGE